VLQEPAPLLYVQEWGLDKHVLAVAAWAATPDYLPVQQQLLEELGRAADAFRPPAAIRSEPGASATGLPAPPVADAPGSA
jgi:hypothetical protein